MYPDCLNGRCGKCSSCNWFNNHTIPYAKAKVEIKTEETTLQKELKNLLNLLNEINHSTQDVYLNSEYLCDAKELLGKMIKEREGHLIK